MKIILTLLLLLLSPFALAVPMAEQVKVCYLFENNQLKHKSNCSVLGGNDGGGSYQSMQIGNTEYSFESPICYDKPTDHWFACGNTLNDEVAESYHRDQFYRVIEDDSLISDSSLSCYRSAKMDICHD